MSAIFNFTRFINLFKKNTAENLKIYLMSLAILTGILFLVLGYAIYVNNENFTVGLQQDIFISFYLGAGTIFTSSVFSDAGEKKKAIALLTLPASDFEKFLVKWLFSFVIFQILFLAVFYSVVLIILNLLPGKDRSLLDIFHVSKTVEIFLGYAAFNAFFIWGSLFFNKLHFIKTGILYFLGFIILLFANKYVISSIVSSKILIAIPFSDMFLPEKNTFYTIHSTEKSNMLFLIMLALLAFVFWAAAYFRLKEKQV